MSLYHLNVTAHLLAAFFWLGGMFFLALVGAPVLRQLDDPGLRARLFGELGRRFRSAGWWAIGVLVATGVANLHFRGVLDAGVLGDPAFWSGAWGRALTWKLGAVGAMIVTSALHDFVFGPRAAGDRTAADDAGAGGGRPGDDGSGAAGGDPRGADDRARKMAGWLARLNALLGIVVVLAAVRLARGG
jgi:putative copper export protein